ncbi:MAG: redoxin domain-containing protein [Planctomycetia bacterium]|nr:redoxin domain-containing protein [Planctomycetia bacterium]
MAIRFLRFSMLFAICLASCAAFFARCATAAETGSAYATPVLVDRWGVEHLWSTDLTSLPDGPARGYAVVFLDVNCPIVTRMAPVLNELSGRYLAERVQFIGVYSNAGLTRMKMASHKQKLDLAFPVFLDVDGGLARLLKARATPEAFLLDEKLAVRYRGMINDGGWKKSPGAKNTDYLADAIDALLTGGKAIAETRAQGCELQLPPVERKLAAKTLTYHDDAAKIIHKRCVSCHYPGGIGPFELSTFESVRDEAATIRREVAYQRMPPWHADDSRGLAIEDVQALTDEERRTIIDWIDQGLARQKSGEAEWLVAGTPPAVPLALPKLPKPGEFTIGSGKPDYVVRMPKPFMVKASSVVEYQYFWVPNDLNEDRYIQALELLPGNRRVVHHMQAFLISKKQRPADTTKPLSGAFMMAKVNGYGGKDCWRIGSYTPGDQYSARTFAPDEGVHFPAGFDLVFEIHYTSIDEDATDRSSVGIVWRKNSQPPAKLIADQLFLRPRNIDIEPHAPHTRTEWLPYFKQNVLLIDVRPHMHLRGGDAQLTVVYPDGREELLVVVPAFDFNWQRRYLFREPVRLPAGSTLKFVGHWDNTRLNPNNPNPESRVLFGEESTDEMSNLGVTYRVDTEAEMQALRRMAPVTK